jgi:iron-sulfur cluster assembly accessory protein
VFEKNGSKVVIDHGSFEMIKGSTVDFMQEMIRSTFAIVNNPQSESACGCGSSFAVKNFDSNPALD